MTEYKRKEVIGGCTLYLGDCLEVMPTLGKVDAVVTDPPYGVSFQSNRRKERHLKIYNDDSNALLLFATSLEPSHSLYVFGRWENLADIPKPKSVITWVKDNHSMGDLNHEHGRQTELCFFYGGEKHFFKKRPNDVIRCARTGNNLHPTEKPVPLMEVICGWTDGVIVDPFMGSGTTGVACAKMGRKFIGIEMEEKYFDIACKRVEEAYEQPDLLVSQPDAPKQEKFL